MDEVLRVERLGHVARLTICREHAGNSASEQVLMAIEQFLDATEDDRELRAIVLTGSGDRFFCSGGDVKRYRAIETREQLRDAFARPRDLMHRLEVFRCPIVAAVNGWSLGGGAELMLACDIRIAAPHARIGFPYAKLSLAPGWHGSERLVRAVGDAQARYLLLSAEPVSADEALRIGLVQEVVSPGTLCERALALAQLLAERAPASAGAIKRVLSAIHADSHSSARACADAEFEELWVSEDHREAEAAFVEKRKPQFTGR